MKDLWKWYIVLGYILLPFVALYKLIKNWTKNMSDWQAFFYYFILIIITLQIIEIITNL